MGALGRYRRLEVRVASRVFKQRPSPMTHGPRHGPLPRPLSQRERGAPAAAAARGPPGRTGAVLAPQANRAGRSGRERPGKKVGFARYPLLTSAAALPYTVGTSGQRWHSGETGSEWAGKSSTVALFAALFDICYLFEGICGRFGFVSTDGLLGYRLTRGFGSDDVGSQLHVSGASCALGMMTMCERFSLVKDSAWAAGQPVVWCFQLESLILAQNERWRQA